MKSSTDTKTVCYSAQKRLEMTETTSVDDVQIAVYRGSRVIEIVPDPKTVCYSPQKRPEMLETASFDDNPIIVYRM